MPTTYKTPGVYVEEISTLPPSVAEVSSAIPAFIGFTEKGEAHVPRRISSMLEYGELFGGPPTAITSITMPVDPGSGGDPTVELSDSLSLLHDSMRLYFSNGGGPCYVVPAGDHTTGASDLKEGLLKGLEAIGKEDEPTLLVIPDSVRLEQADHRTVCEAALNLCGDLKDRFAILDVWKGDTEGFRSASSDFLAYGAAYTPYLQTTMTYAYEENKVTVKGIQKITPETPIQAIFEKKIGGITVRFTGNQNANPSVEITGKGSEPQDLQIELANESSLEILLDTVTSKSVTAIIEEWNKAGTVKGNFEIIPNGESSSVTPTEAPIPLDSISQEPVSSGDSTLADLAKSNTGLYNRLKSQLATLRITLPPSSAMAGVYARVDRERGVWKAPANVSISSIIGPVTKITDADQEGLNVDPTGGKSINAIRSFAGRGTLVWGARTLAGNDNEWRYISVRRLFNVIEESTKKASFFAVFEPNDATTWLKVKAMIESYLYGLWEQGALAGPTPEAAYFVNVGLGKTMTTDDILNGRLIVKIGIAAVRPAEFIVLSFSHKLQEA